MINGVIILIFASIGAITTSKFIVTKSIRIKQAWQEVRAENEDM